MTPQQMTLALAVALYAIALLLARLPVRCPHDCAQCRADVHRRRVEADQRSHDYYHRQYGGDSCPRCRKDE